MKKNIIKVALVAVVGLIAGINVFNAQKSDVLSDVAMANVEALAQTENTPKYSVYPCPDGPGTECNTASKDRLPCYIKTYCQ